MTLSGWPLTPEENKAFDESLNIYKEYIRRGMQRVDLLKIHFDEHIIANLLASSLGQINGWLGYDDIDRASGTLLLLFSAFFACGFTAGKAQAGTIERKGNGDGPIDA